MLSFGIQYYQLEFRAKAGNGPDYSRLACFAVNGQNAPRIELWSFACPIVKLP